jgi:hypothetical protein
MSTAIGLEKSIGVDRAIDLRVVSPGFRLPVFVIFTSINRTLKALEKANQLAKPLQTGIVILAIQMVPYSLPLDEPPVPFEFVVRRLEEMADQFPEKTKISAYLCRDPMEALKSVLKHNCPVVMGIRKRWWPTRDERLARKLRHAGYDVILVEME